MLLGYYLTFTEQRFLGEERSLARGHEQVPDQGAWSAWVSPLVADGDQKAPMIHLSHGSYVMPERHCGWVRRVPPDTRMVTCTSISSTSITSSTNSAGSTCSTSTGSTSLSFHSYNLVYFGCQRPRVCSASFVNCLPGTWCELCPVPGARGKH